MSTLRWASEPSSSTAKAPHSSAMVPSSTSVMRGSATRSPDAAGEHRRALGHEVGLEAVAAGLVEQHAAAAGADDDRHGAGRRRAGRQLQQRALGGLAGDVVHVVGVEELEADRAAERLVAGLHAGVARRHRHDGEERADLVVLGEEAVAVGDEDAAAAVAVARRDLA